MFGVECFLLNFSIVIAHPLRGQLVSRHIVLFRDNENKKNVQYYITVYYFNQSIY